MYVFCDGEAQSVPLPVGCLPVWRDGVMNERRHSVVAEMPHQGVAIFTQYGEYVEYMAVEIPYGRQSDGGMVDSL